MNFAQYWEQNKDLFTQLGVTEAAAKKIWNDACDAVEKKLIEHYISKL